MNATVKKDCIVSFGSISQARISLPFGQKWKVLSCPDIELQNEPNTFRVFKNPYYTITRKGISMDMMENEFNEFFEVQDG